MSGEVEEKEVKKKPLDLKQFSVDLAAQEMLAKAEAENIATCFSRAEEMKPCVIGATGACCKYCFMGPCRLTGKEAESKTGICGATLATISARNFARMVAAGTSAHSDHARDLAFALRAVAKGEAQGYSLKDEVKLRNVATSLGIPVEDRSKEEIALDLAEKCIGMFGQQEGEIEFINHAVAKRQEIWRRLGVVPRGIDREVVEMLHRTSIGVDQDPANILTQAIRTSMADGWGGSMIATHISDILFGTPSPLLAEVNLGVLKEDEVNIIVHGHEPLLSEMVVAAVQDPDMVAYAKSKGAKGITLSGICCTANEVLMRHGIPPAGNFLHQELAIITGAVDAMVVDVQCVMEALSPLAAKFHTKLITTSAKAKIPGAVHVQFDEHKALDVAKEIVKLAIDNYPNRGKTKIPSAESKLIAGFSHEYINYMLGGRFRASFRPLNDNIMNGRIKGAVAIVGCNNPRTCQDESHNFLVRELIKNDYLVLQSGCGAHANAKYGLLLPEAMKDAGPGLREICETVGIPPVLHVGSCVDNSRILNIVNHMVEEGGLGDDTSDLPIAGIAPEWMSEKAIAIATYCVASGAYVVFGVGSPVSASSEVTRILSEDWERDYGGKLEFYAEKEMILEKVIDHITKKRKALNIDVKKERVLYDMEMRRQLSV